jgi:hypothetical protein
VIKLLVLFAHLLATCAALGAILATDLRLLGRVWRADFRLGPPNRFVTRLVGASLVLLVASGAALVVLALQEQPDALANPKLQLKIALVALLALNAAVLHRWAFPWLASGRRIRPWSARVGLGVALPVAVSNALWLFAAFLGIARPWNHVVPAVDLVVMAAALVVVAWVGVMGLLQLAARRQRQRRARTTWLPQAQAAREAARVIGRARAGGGAPPRAPSSPRESARH